MGVNQPDGIDTIVVDYGGVLTNPLRETYAAFAARVGIGIEEIMRAFADATRRLGRTPMAALEVAAITERQMVDELLAELPEGTGDPLAGRPFGELWFQGRRANKEFLDYLRELRADGFRLALLTNNVREWEQRWRAQIPVDELFSVVVNSAHEGVRKPDPRIYRILLGRLDARAEQCLFVDDDAANCAAARQLGIRTVQFTHTAQAVESLDEILRTRREPR
ncbi:HAD family phosphatase [Micromonospora sp. NPDC023888]|uniref:HAD family hydrolase n=1 Tax=Micromonospora sp. NPDC023888 TaxID=3155607 RepID=UPI0033F3AC23